MKCWMFSPLSSSFAIHESGRGVGRRRDIPMRREIYFMILASDSAIHRLLRAFRLPLTPS